MTDAELSREAGKYPNYLSHLKHTNEAKYNLMKEYGILGFEDRCLEIRQDLADMYNDLVKDRGIKAYSDSIGETYHTFSSWLNYTAFGNNEYMTVFTYNKAERILNGYRTRLSEKDNQDTRGK